MKYVTSIERLAIERGRQLGMEQLARIYDLRRAALNWESSGLGLLRAELRAPVIHEKSLLDLLCAKRLDLEAIQFAGERLALKRELSAKRKLADPFR